MRNKSPKKSGKKQLEQELKDMAAQQDASQLPLKEGENLETQEENTNRGEL